MHCLTLMQGQPPLHACPLFQALLKKRRLTIDIPMHFSPVAASVHLSLGNRARPSPQHSAMGLPVVNGLMHLMVERNLSWRWMNPHLRKNQRFRLSWWWKVVEAA